MLLHDVTDFTVVSYNRRPIFLDARARGILGDKLRECQNEWPFAIDAIVLLPEHLHTIWSLPRGDDNYPARWSWIKKEFTKEWLAGGGTEGWISRGKRNQRRRGDWQPRYWEHTCEDEDDFAIRFNYIHFNPVKHRHVRRPRDWPWSSFHRWVDAGVYERSWACSAGSQPDFSSIEDNCGEP
jgi:putative transposase